MPVGGVAREQSLEDELEVGLAATSGLEQGDSGGGVRDEHVAQSVTERTAELQDEIRDVGRQPRTRPDRDELADHEVIVPG